jgi:GNAT superfamily N-acetyltransferase
MTGIPERELSILLLSSRYDLSPFDSGDAELNDFLKNDALREQKEFLSKTHLCFYRDRVAGFISMAADSVQAKKDKLDPSQIIDDCEYPVYPCILIARLAVDKKLHGYGVGSYLLSLAVGYAMESPLGCRYLAVDPKDSWTKSQRRMFLNLRDVSEQMQMNESLDLWTKNDNSETKSSTV